MKRHTILHTIETGGTGGAETVLLKLASKLDRSRFRSLALLPDDGWLRDKLEQQGVPTFVVRWKAWYDFRLPTAMTKLIRQEKVDLIHSHLPGQNFYSCLAGMLTGRKTLVSYHGAVEFSDAERLRGGTKLWFVRRSAAAAIVVCDHVGRLLAHTGFPAERIARIYNGIETERFQVPATGRLCAELGFPTGTRLVGMVANVQHPKGYDFFIRAARRVIQAMPDVRFIAVGEFDPGMPEITTKLIQELNLENHFFFLGFREDVPEILSELDVFVLSSVSEGLPLAMLEAMAAGKAVVATRSGGVQEVIEDGRTGLLVPPGDADALAATILEVLRDPQRAAALGGSACAAVTGKFSFANMISDYERLYERFLNST